MAEHAGNDDHLQDTGENRAEDARSEFRGHEIGQQLHLVKAAYDGGMKMFDTAHGYMNGRNEEMLGKLLFSTVPRDSFILATKVKPAGVDSRTGLPSKETTAADFLPRFELSLAETEDGLC
ncbi:MAG: aldo/keto reductase [Marinilabiliales bacterium]|nr:aldo/keto reductase [Marinilabiliales bacterium]